ncbi:MAG: SDR family oxidoreductase [Bacteroidota bacterium]
MSKILVTGVTGQLGKAVIDLLINKVSVSSLAVLVRDAAKAENLKAQGVDIRVGDYNDETSLVSAFEGIDKLYFVSSNDILNRTQQHQNVVNAAKTAQVKQVIYTSFQRKNETETSPISFIAESHLKTEQFIKESGLNYTILKNGMYLDVLPMFLGEKVIETGTIFFPAGEGNISFTLRNEMAEASAVILTSDGHENKEYDFNNEETVTLQEIATLLSEIAGKTINYISPTQEVYIETLSAAGVPMEYVGMFAGFAEAFEQNEFDQTSNTIETLIGRKPLTIKAYLKQVYAVK